MPEGDPPPPPESVQVAVLRCGHCRYELRPVYLDRRGDTYIIINGERRVRGKVLCHICGTFTKFRSVYAPQLGPKGNSMTNREAWLNGWGRIGRVVIVETVRCAGCGKDQGTAAVLVPEDWKAPEKPPDWPFNEKDCPICELENRLMELVRQRVDT